MPYLDSYIDPSLNPDDLIRKRNLMMGFPNITGFDQPLDQAPSEPTPWYLQQNQTPEQKAGESPLQQPPPTGQVQGIGGQPPAQPPAAANAAAISPYAKEPFQMAAEAEAKLKAGYDPTQDLQSVAQDIRQTREAMPGIGPDSPMGRAAAGLQTLERRPTAYDVDPATGQQKYPVNKLEKVLLSPFMFKQMIHDPLGTREKMDLLTRKGYGQAEQQWYDTYEQRKRDFDLNTAATNQIYKGISERLSADNSLAGISRTLWDANKEIAKLPIDFQATATSIASQQANTVREGAPKYDPQNLFTAFVKDAAGKYHQTVVYPKTYPDGRPPEFIEPGKNVPLKDFLLGGKAELGSISGVNRLILDGINQYVQNNGKMPEGKDLDDIVAHADEVIARPREKAAEEAAVRAETRATTAEDRRYRDAAIAQYTADTRQDRNKINDQTRKLQGLVKTLDVAANPTDPNDIAQVLALSELATTLSNPGASMSRYQSREIGDMRQSPGKLVAIGAELKSWAAGGPPISPQVLADAKRLAAAQLGEFTLRQQIYNEADKQIATVKPGPMARYEVEQIREQRDALVNEVFGASTGETLEQEKKRLEDEQKRRKSGQHGASGSW